MTRPDTTIWRQRSRFAGDGTAVGHLLFAVLLFVVLLPTGALGQPAPVQSLIEQGRQAGADADLMQTVATRAETAGLSPQQTTELLRPAVALAERDLPTRPLLNKTLEGLAKRVPPARMSPVLQRFQTHTEQAGQLVSGWLERGDVQRLLGSSGKEPAARTQLITNVTEAQQQDLPLGAVEQFLGGLPENMPQQSVPLSQVATAISVMPDVPGGTRNLAVTRQLLTAALNAGYDAESLRQLPAALERAQRGTQRPATAIARGVTQAIAKGTPAASVLRSLFQGGMPGGGPPSGAGEGPPGTPPGQGKPPGQGGKPPGTGPPDDPGRGDGPPDDPGGGPPGGDSGGGGR